MMDRERTTTTESGPGMDDRGISEVVAFILTFAIILGSVGLLYSTAFGAMIDYQEAEQDTNAVRAMDSLTDNFNDVLRSNGVNERYGELSLREGTVTTGDDGTAVNVTIRYGSDNQTKVGHDDDRFANYSDDATVELGEFAYESDNGKIAYEGGGLVRGDGSGSAVLREPQLRCEPERDTAIISLVAISADDRSISSSGGQGFRMTVEDRDSVVYTKVENVTVSVEEDTAYEGAWNDVFSDTWSDGNDENPTGTCDFGGDGRVVVTIVEADIEY